MSRWRHCRPRWRSRHALPRNRWKHCRRTDGSTWRSLKCSNRGIKPESQRWLKSALILFIFLLAFLMLTNNRHVHLLLAIVIRLQRTQSFLYENTRDFLQLKFETRSHEKCWMMEKDQLLQQLDSCQEKLREHRGSQALGCSAPILSTPTPELQSHQTQKQEIRVGCLVQDQAIQFSG